MTTGALAPAADGTRSGPARWYDQTGWMENARLPCRVHDPDLWFADRPSGVEEAKARCRECPVREMCLAGALERREPWGVWGGELFLRGVVIPRKRPPGRPRKHDPEVA